MKKQKILCKKKSLNESSLFINEVSETFKNETKKQKVDFSQRY